jgi:hypothetical protein
MLCSLCINARWLTTKLEEMTASQRLTLEEEYDMQISWMNDPKSKQPSLAGL